MSHQRDPESISKRPRARLGFGRARGIGLGATLLVLAAAPAAAASFTGATVPRQTDVASTSGVVPVRVSCPASAAKSCSGTLSLRTAKKVGGKIQSLGTARFSITSGHTAKVRLKLNAEGRKLIKGGKISPIATARSHDGTGHSARQSRQITIKKHGQTNPNPGGLY